MEVSVKIRLMDSSPSSSASSSSSSSPPSPSSSSRDSSSAHIGPQVTPPLPSVLPNTVRRVRLRVSRAAQLYADIEDLFSTGHHLIHDYVPGGEGSSEEEEESGVQVYWHRKGWGREGQDLACPQVWSAMMQDKLDAVCKKEPFVPHVRRVILPETALYLTVVLPRSRMG